MQTYVRICIIWVNSAGNVEVDYVPMPEIEYVPSFDEYVPPPDTIDASTQTDELREVQDSTLTSMQLVQSMGYTGVIITSKHSDIC